VRLPALTWVNDAAAHYGIGLVCGSDLLPAPTIQITDIPE